MMAGSRERLRGIFFDLDDTLIAYSQAEQAAIMAGCRLAAQIESSINARSLAAAILEVYANDFAYGTPGFADLASFTVQEFRTIITGRALKLFGIDDPAFTDTLVMEYASAERSALYTYSGVAETLKLLRPHFRLGVITNGPSAMQREKLAVLALDDLFEEIVVDTEFGHPKPDSRIFEHAARRAGLRPAEMMFAGNSLAADVAGAREAGWTPVWVREIDALPEPETATHGHGADYVVDSVARIVSLPPVAQVLEGDRTNPVAENSGRARRKTAV